MAIGRLFTEIGAKSTLPEDLKASLDALGEVGLKATGMGKSMLDAFDKALDPSKALTQQLVMLEAAGKSEADITTVMRDKIISLSEAAVANGQTLSPLARAYYDLAKATDPKEPGSAGFSIEALGQGLINFAKDPLGTAQNALVGFLETLGPIGVGLGAIGGGLVAAGISLFNFATNASDTQERLDRLSSSTGLSVQQLQALELIAANAGLEGLNLGRTIGKLNTELAKGDASAFGKELGDLGIDLNNMDGSAKDAVTLLDEIRLKLLAIPDPIARAHEQSAIFSGRLRELGEMLMTSKDGLEASMQKFIEWKLTTGEATQEALRSWDSYMDAQRTGITWLKNEAIAILMDVLDQYKNQFQGWLTGMSSIWTGAKDALWGYIATIPGAIEALNKLGLGLKDVAGAADLAEGSASKLDVGFGVALDKSTASILIYGPTLKQLTEQTEEAAKKQAALLAAFNDSVAPADALAAKLNALIAAGANQNQVIAENAVKMQQAIKDQKSHNVELDAAAVKWGALVKPITDARAEVALYDKFIKDLEKDCVSTWAAFVKGVGDVHTALSEGIAKLTKENKLPEIGGDVNLVNDALKSLGIEIPKDEVLWASFNTEASKTKTMGADMKAAFTSAFDSLTKSLAANIIEWKGWGDSLKSFLKSLATDILDIMLKGFLKPFTDSLGTIMTNFGGQVASLFAGNGFDVSSLLSGAGLSLGAGAGTGAAGAGAGGTAAAWGSYGSAAATTATSTANTVAQLAAKIAPWAGMAAAAWNLASASYGYAQGDPTNIRIMQDIGTTFPGIDFGVSQLGASVQGIVGAAGGNENAYNIRKELYTSPAFLSEVLGPLAQGAGKMDAFLTSLEKVTTSWGTFDFRAAFEKGMASGDYAELNKLYASTIGDISTELNRMVPDWKTLLMAPETTAISETTKGATDAIAAWTGEVGQSNLIIATASGTMADMFNRQSGAAIDFTHAIGTATEFTNSQNLAAKGFTLTTIDATDAIKGHTAASKDLTLVTVGASNTMVDFSKQNLSTLAVFDAAAKGFTLTTIDATDAIKGHTAASKDLTLVTVGASNTMVDFSKQNLSTLAVFDAAAKGFTLTTIDATDAIKGHTAASKDLTEAAGRLGNQLSLAAGTTSIFLDKFGQGAGELGLSFDALTERINANRGAMDGWAEQQTSIWAGMFGWIKNNLFTGFDASGNPVGEPSPPPSVLTNPAGGGNTYNINVTTGAVIGTNGDQVIADSIQRTISLGGLSNINNTYAVARLP